MMSMMSMVPVMIVMSMMMMLPVMWLIVWLMKMATPTETTTKAHDH